MGFSFYTVDSDYCDFLREKDSCVPFTMDSKANRPFVGIVFCVNGFNYFAPLTSPKPKHKKMKNQTDFLKIKGGEWGAINLNNMIPVTKSALHKIEINLSSSLSVSEIAYNNLLSNQLSWCNANRVVILRQAEKLYNIITTGKARDELRLRCCSFLVDEERCRLYSQK